MKLNIDAHGPTSTGYYFLLIKGLHRLEIGTWLTPGQAKALADCLLTGDPIPVPLTRVTGLRRVRGQLTLVLMINNVALDFTFAANETTAIAEALLSALNPPPGLTRADAIKAAGKQVS